jgi:hypothetical protein
MYKLQVLKAVEKFDSHRLHHHYSGHYNSKIALYSQQPVPVLRCARSLLAFPGEFGL